MGPVAGLVEQEPRAPRDDLFAEAQKRLQDRLQVHQLRLATVERHEIAAERRLQHRVAIELVEHDIGHGISLELDHHPHALAVGFVANIGDAFDALVAHHLGDLFDHRRLVHLVGNLVNDQRFAFLANLLGRNPSAHQHRAAARLIGRPDPRLADDDARRRKVRPGDDFHQLLDGDVGIVHHGQTRVDHLAQIVAGNVCGHAHGDAAAAIDDQVRKACRQNRRFALA